MNYTIESGFLDDEILDIILWSEAMLHDFVSSKDTKLGLNKCSQVERFIIKLLCKSFFVNFYDNNKQCYVERTEDTREPFLNFKDYFTTKKIRIYFQGKKGYFYDNIKEFPKDFKKYISEIRKLQPVINHKLTNKEVEMRSIMGNDMEEDGENINKNAPDYEDEGIMTPEGSGPSRGSFIKGRDRMNSQGSLGDFKAMSGVISPKHEEIKSGEEQETEENLEEENLEEENLEEETEPEEVNTHALGSKVYKKVEWDIPKRADLSRLPCLHHILFIILNKEEEEQILEILSTGKKGIRLKLVHNLGIFFICESEALACKWFQKLKEDFTVFPLKSLPNDIKVDALRSEFCFMEGVRPKKTTVVAERFIKRHLGYKNYLL